MFNRSEIMKAAWATYRSTRRPHHTKFMVEDFAFYLKCAWHEAKMAALPPTVRRIVVVRQELDSLKFKPLRIDIATRRRSLETELAALTHGA